MISKSGEREKKNNSKVSRKRGCLDVGYSIILFRKAYYHLPSLAGLYGKRRFYDEILFYGGRLN